MYLFSYTFLINLILLIFLSLTLNFIIYQIFIIFLKKLKFCINKIQFFNKAHKGNFLACLVLGMSILTILYTQPTSYTFFISKKIAVFGPITIFIIGIIMITANLFFNYKLIKKLRYLDIDKIS